MQNGAIEVHPLTSNPTCAWNELSQKQKVIKVNVKLPTKPVEPDKVRFVCMSDTHSLIHSVKFDVPDGDVLLHAGDFTKCGKLEEVEEFDNWLGKNKLHHTTLNNLLHLVSDYLIKLALQMNK